MRKVNKFNDFKNEQLSLIITLDTYRDIFINDISNISKQEQKRLFLKCSDEIRNIKTKYSDIITFKIFIIIHILLHYLNLQFNKKTVDKFVRHISILKTELNNLEVLNDF